jgi:hypothetical protein
MSNVIVGLNEIREAVFSMPERFTIRDVIAKVKSSHPDKEEVDAMVVRAYLEQIGRAGIVEEHRGMWWVNIPDFDTCPYCGAHK